MNDFRFAWRTLLRNPGFTLVVILTLALGIGASTAVFGVFHALLLRPLPLEHLDRQVYFLSLREGFDPFGISAIEWVFYREHQSSFQRVGASEQRSYNLTGDGEPEPVQGAAIDAGYLETLGARPILGRSFTAEDDLPGGPDLAILGYDLWQRRFAGNHSVLGRTLLVDQKAYQIVGVMPPGFALPEQVELWTPLHFSLANIARSDQVRHSLAVVGLLRPGLTIDQARSEMRSLALRMAAQSPDTNRGWSATVVPLREELLGDVEGRIPAMLRVVLALVGFLLLIACANVAHLLLARGLGRQNEMAVRRALGAGRWNLVRPLLSETLLLAFAGGITGVLLAHWLTPLLVAVNPIQAAAYGAWFGNVGVDLTVLGFALLATMVTAVIFGLVPAFRITASADVAGLLKRSGKRLAGESHPLMRFTVISQIAIATALLVGAGLFLRTFQHLQLANLGFRPERLLSMDLALSPAKYRTPEQKAAFVNELVERVRALPGVSAAGVTTNRPLDILSYDAAYRVEGRAPVMSGEVPITAHRVVSPRYLETLGVTLVSGRLLTAQDTATTQPVVVVSEDLAASAWPGQDPLGKRLQQAIAGVQRPWLTVVGVIREIKEDRSNFRISRPAWYLPYAQYAAYAQPGPLRLMVRAEGDPAALTPSLRTVIHSIDPNQTIAGVLTMPEFVSGVYSTERFGALLAGVFAVLGLSLACVGLYGLQAYAVRQRESEIGLRMALGANPRAIFSLFVGQSLRLAATGLVLGLGAAAVFTRWISGLLYGVAARDPLTFVLVSVTLLGVTIVAGLIPARRAAGVAPAVALRGE